MSDSASQILFSASQECARLLDSIFRSLQGMRENVSPLLNVPDLSHRRLAELEPAVRRLTARHPGLITGAGLAVAPGALADAPAWMQSWHYVGQELRFTHHSLDPSTVNYYDYTEMEWFAEPVRSQQPYITEPYMDFGGTDSLIVTASLPVDSWDNSVSVVAADLSLAFLERAFLSWVGARGDIALIGKDNRLIATNSARLAVVGRVDPPFSTVAPADTDEVTTGWRLVVMNP